MGAIRIALVLFLVMSLAGIAVLPRLIGVNPPEDLRPVEIGPKTGRTDDRKPKRNHGPAEDKADRSELTPVDTAAPQPSAETQEAPPAAAPSPTEPAVPATSPPGDDDEGDDDDDGGDD